MVDWIDLLLYTALPPGEAIRPQWCQLPTLNDPTSDTADKLRAKQPLIDQSRQQLTKLYAYKYMPMTVNTTTIKI